MRILQVSDTYLPVLGGIEVLVDDLARRQRLDGHQVEIVTCTRSGTDDEQVVRLRHPLRSDLTSLLEHFGPDVVHCHSSIVSPLAWRAARQAARAGLPVLTTMHSIVPATGVVPVALRRLAGRMPRSVTWSAVSGTAAAALAPIVGAEVLVLPNGIDRDACHPARPGSSAVPLIVSVMRLSHRKRPLELIEVLSRLQALTADQPWQALIVGDGPREAAVTRAVRRAGLGDRVHLTGRLTRPQIMHLLARADLYLAPAYLESFGLAALEARCSGLPVVAMSSGGVGEFVEDGVNGYLVEDDAEMVRRAGQLLADRALLGRLAESSRADPPDLGWPRTVGRTLEAYREAGALVPSEAALPQPTAVSA
jgi:glycosyltransferase involved in cell wall biosynthesis